MNRDLKYLALCLVLAFLTGCKPKVPKEIIQPRKMEKLLYDYHLVEGIVLAEGNYTSQDTLKMIYRKAVFDKYGVTQAQFDSSLVYYYRHADKLHDMYVNVSKKYNEEMSAMGSPSVAQGGTYANLTAYGDTAIAWKGASSSIIMPYPPYNFVSYSLKADTAFHQGDKVMLSFDTNFLYQEGNKDAVAYMAVRYLNDSVATQVLHLYSDSHYSMTLASPKDLGIKSISGFVGLMRGQGNDSETLKLLCLSNLCVIRIHTDNGKKHGAPPDTLSNGKKGVINIDDSLHPGQKKPPVPPRTLTEKMELEKK